MTANWFILILWLFAAAISTIEMYASYLENGLASFKTFMFFFLLLTSIFFIIRLRKIRYRDKVSDKD